MNNSKNRYFISTLIISFILSIGLNCTGIPAFINKLHMGRGEIFAEKQQYQEAIEKFNQVIDDQSIKYLAYIDRASAYYNLGEYEKALQDCDSLIFLNADNWYPYYLKAHIHFKLNNVEQAMENINIAINKGNDIIASLYSSRAMFNLNIVNFLAALNDCNKAIKIDSTDSLAYKVRGIVFLQAGQIDPSELEKAMVDFNKAVALDSTDYEAYYDRALAYIMQKKYPEAIIDLECAANLCDNPSDLELIQKKLNEIQ